jgi:hypothetical protein
MTDKTLRLKSFTDLHHFDWLTCSGCRRLIWWDSQSNHEAPAYCTNCGQVLLP